MKKKNTLFTVFVMCLLLLTSLFAAEFSEDENGDHNPSPYGKAPENCGQSWDSPFPYQRNIKHDFDTDPTTNPTVDYEGICDARLYDSDYVEFTGDVVWAGYLSSWHPYV